ncbi:hypothetical protein LMG29739_06033 [Paraburkholderia solisilvae]|uniref:Uncharacterized protein n=4 Tax=Paraburkholderia solisilvae TaxID=624376 RepID=A0A6J5F192_9BURK|nr:hypothetical protein LMG29739_06033 [Paraburkholderia solisilvae]
MPADATLATRAAPDAPQVQPVSTARIDSAPLAAQPDAAQPPATLR